MIHSPAECAEAAWMALVTTGWSRGAKQRGGLYGWMEGIPLDDWIEGCLLTKHLVVLQPALTSMSLGFAYHDAGIGKSVSRLLIRAPQRGIRQEAVLPGGQ